MAALYGSSMLDRGLPAGVWAGMSRYFLIVSQPMCRWRSILRMGQWSDQYKRCRSLICSVVSMGSILIYTRRASLEPERCFFTRFRWKGDNPLEYYNFGESYVVLYKIGRIWPNQPNLCRGML